MGAFIIKFPVETPDVSMFMILNDNFVIRNIARDTSTEITNNTPQKRMRPVPPGRQDQPTKVTYTAQALCEKDEFEEFYNRNLGKSVKMNFEGWTYYGYLSNMVIGDEDVTFDYTYTSRVEMEPVLV